MSACQYLVEDYSALLLECGSSDVVETIIGGCAFCHKHLKAIGSLEGLECFFKKRLVYLMLKGHIKCDQ